MLWHRRSDRHPAHCWFRDLLISVAKSIVIDIPNHGIVKVCLPRTVRINAVLAEVSVISPTASKADADRYHAAVDLELPRVRRGGLAARPVEQAAPRRYLFR